MTLPIDVVLTESELARDFLTALERRHVPEKLFYWSPLSVRAWLALCSGDTRGGYRNSDRSRELVRHHSRAIAARAPTGAIEVISLGAGQGDKDRIILGELARGERDVWYRPVDASIGLLEIAVRDAIVEGHRTIGVKADFAAMSQLVESGVASGALDATRVVLMLGNTLGAFDPPALARQLAQLLRAGDLAVVDGEIFAGAETLAGYDNPVNRRFAFAPLEVAGLTAGDGELAFEISYDETRSGLFRVEKHFTLTRDALLRVGGESIELRAGERLSMSPSHKYDEAGFLSVLKDAGLSPAAMWRSEDSRFVMAMVERGRRVGEGTGRGG
jgi:uncharacterized SAM-dependent methyltransferase